MKHDIVLIVDHKWRDLPGMALLAAMLESEHGCSLRLIPYSMWQEALAVDRPQVLCVSALYGARGREIIRVCRETGTKLAVIMTEGRPNSLQSLAYCVGKESNSKHADLWIAWSRTVKDYMLKEGVLPEEKIPVAGAVRFDIYKPPFNKVIMPRSEFAAKYGLDPLKPTVSWATNFTHAKFHLKNREFLVKDWKDLGLSGYDAYSKPLEAARLDWETRNECAAIIKDLLRVRPDLQLAVKPHPAEDHKYYEEFVSECRKEFGPRVVFVGFEYIWDLLNAVDVHIHRLCTTGVEAWFLDVPSIDFHIRDYMPWSVDLPGAASEAVPGNDLVTTAQGLIKRVNFFLAGGRHTPEQYKAREEYIKKWLYKVDGKRAYENAASIAALAGAKRRIKRPAFSRKNFRLYAKTAATRLLGGRPRESLEFLLSGRKSKVDRIGHVDKTITAKDVSFWLAKMRPFASQNW